MATIKRCDVCHKKATSANPIRNIRMYSHMDVVNGKKIYRQVDTDVCLDCRNKLNDLVSVIEYEFYQYRQYTEVKDVNYSKIVYEEVENPEGSPVENGYFELQDGGIYILSEDTEVDDTKTYYAEVIIPGDNPTEKGWYEIVDGVYQLSEDTEADRSTTYFEKIKECDC